jgi:hypothetical protein
MTYPTVTSVRSCNNVEKGSFLLAWNLFNSNFSVLIESCNFDVEKYSLCVYVRYAYTEWRHWSRANKINFNMMQYT